MEKETMCCPKFDPTPWDGKTFEWKDKPFVKGKVFTILYMPIGFGEMMKKLDEKVRATGATSKDFMCLSDHTSMWNMNVYLAVDKDVEGLETKKISGKFVSKVYEGEFKDTGKWMADFAKYVADQKLKLVRPYMWYTTCPKCAKVYGKNYVVIIGRVE